MTQAVFKNPGTVFAANRDAKGDQCLATAGGSAGRFSNIDRLRLIALIDIVSYHAGGIHVLGGMGLPIFLVLTVALNARPRAGMTLQRFAQRKLTVFMVPWLVWSLIYAASYVVSALLHGSSNRVWSWFEPVMLLVGTQRHLWYLVFALVASLIAFMARRATSSIHMGAVVLVGAVLGCAIMVPERLFGSPPGRANEWLLALPCIPIGIALGRCLSIEDTRVRFRYTGLLLIATSIGMLALEAFNRDYSADRYIKALFPIALAVVWRGVPEPLTAQLTRLRLGVYLIHPLIVSAIHLAGHDHDLPLERALITVAGSLLITWVLLHTPLRWLVSTDAIVARTQAAS